MKVQYIIFVFFSILLISCSANKRISAIEYSILEQEIHFNIKSNTIVIKNQSDMAGFKDNNALNVDLREKSVLGFKGAIGGCIPPQIDIKIMRDNRKKLYTVEANVQQNGFCKKLILYQKIFTIDKIKKKYKVIFQLNNLPENKDMLDKKSK